MTRVRKAVIPAAGLGTRFLPATKSSPKEMLPVVDKPAIQYVVEEAVKAGLDRHPDHHRSQQARDRGPLRPQLRARALPRQQRASTTCLKEVQFASDLADIHYVRQTRPARPRARGVGRASSRRRRAVRGAARRRPHGRRRRAAAFDARRARDATAVRASSFAEVAPEEISSYGCIDPMPSESRELGLDDDVVEIRRVVEKPPREEAPSNLAISGRYVFTPEIFTMLDRIEPGRGGELQLTDAIAMLLEQQSVFGVQLPARSLRRRPEARLPAGERRARARPRRPRSRVRRMVARRTSPNAGRRDRRSL